MAWIPWAVTAASALVSAIGQDKTNKSNEATSERQMAFNAEEAEKSRLFSAAQAEHQMSFQERMVSESRDWSEEMANSSYQRAVGDLEKAGLNPMLAYSQGGAPTPATSAPSGAMGQSPAASYSTPVQRQNAAAVGLNSAMAAAQVSNALKSGDNIDADTKLKEAQAAREVSSAANLEANTKDTLYKLQEKVPEEIRELRSRQGTQFWQQQVDAQRVEVLKVEKLLRNSEISNTDAQTRLTEIRTILSKLAEPEARNAANAQDSWWMRNVSPYLPDVFKSTGAAAGVRGLAR